MGDVWGDRLKYAGAWHLMALAAAALMGATASFGQQGVAPAPAPAAPTRTMLVEPPAPLLPPTLGKLTRVAEGDAGDGLGKLDAAGLSAQDKAVLTEDGLKRFAQSEYAAGSPRGATEASVTAYRFLDASGAISAYDYFRKPGMRTENLGDNAVSNGNDLLLRSGVNLVRANIKAGHAAMSGLAKELIGHLPKVGGPAGMAPLLPTLLPANAFDAETIKYALGPVGYAAMGGVLPPNVVGFDKSAETVTARSNTKVSGMLTLVLYPTPEIAGEHLQMIQPAIKQQGASAGTVVLRREGPLLAMTSGAWPAAAAQTMVESIHLRTEVSFDKPMPVEFHAEVKKTYSLLVNIAIFCGVGCLAALVLGLFFGGGRAAIRVLQGKPAATEPEFLRIDLRGSQAKGVGDSEV